MGACSHKLKSQPELIFIFLLDVHSVDEKLWLLEIRGSRWKKKGKFLQGNNKWKGRRKTMGKEMKGIKKVK